MFPLLQILVEHQKRNTPSYDHQAYRKPQNSSIKDSIPIIMQCSQCNFETDMESCYKEHLSTHTQFSINAYREGFDINEDSYSKLYILGQADHFNSKAETFDRQHVNSIRAQDLTIPTIPILNVAVLKCPVNYCTFETTDSEMWGQHKLTHNIQIGAPDLLKCSECMFVTTQEATMNIHIEQHEKSGEIVKEEPTILIPKLNPSIPPDVFRCNNCDYETNLKAFIKRHMLIHTVKIEEKPIAETLKCSQCHFQTDHEKFLKRHQLSHKESKSYKCQKCKFETLYKVMFAKHIQAHNKAKKIKDKGKQDKNILNEIKKEEAPGSCIKCPECSYEAASREQLEIHKKIRHSTNDSNGINLHKCAYCKYQTNWEPCLKRHIDREHPDGKPVKVKKEKIEDPPDIPDFVSVDSKFETKTDLYRCHDCDFTSKSKHYLVLHLKRSHLKFEKPDKTRIGKSEKKSKCYECKFRNCIFQTKIKSNYVHHLRKHQEQNPQRVMFHFCDHCDFIGKSEESLDGHRQRAHLNHEKQVYRCNQCDFKTIFKYSLKTHSIKHKKYSCNVCDEDLESAYALVKHRKMHTSNPKNRIYLCDVCGFQSKNDRSLKMHKKTHNPEFKCPDCPFQTHSKVNFQNHCINHKNADEVTMFPCPHCSYQSRLKRNLAWHMKRHADPSKAQIFRCPSCDYQTFTNAQLKSHLMVHKSKEEVVMLKCDFCTFETKRKSNMVQHRLRHLKDSPDVPLLSCPDCNYTTVAKRHLNKHRKTHNVNPDKMFQCTYCSYKIHRKVYLMRHMENHRVVENYGEDQWPRYSYPPPQPQGSITGVTVVPNMGQNLGHGGGF
ncbi:zinc finger protein 808-like isoform X2 [Anthonomus grandis grandis]|uniref:zinc finger protein 808-like isoform X2 n=1 Tax=Anthonomus grandis grandis TaxID=2921223 RepID=UPI0021654B8A|nr:zinc finger protein 808-like isoform X2 [Anthonomus grandis grandis]